MTGRTQLPNRRQSEILSFEHGGQRFHGSVSLFDPYDHERPAEVFLDAAKPGSAMNAMARDAAVTASLALQFGVPLDTLRSALTRDDDGEPSGPLGRLLDLIAVEQLQAGRR